MQVLHLNLGGEEPGIHFLCMLCYPRVCILPYQISNKYKKKLFYEVGMAVLKSMQTRVGMIEINQVQRSSLLFPTPSAMVSIIEDKKKFTK